MVSMAAVGGSGLSLDARRMRPIFDHDPARSAGNRSEAEHAVETLRGYQMPNLSYRASGAAIDYAQSHQPEILGPQASAYDGE